MMTQSETFIGSPRECAFNIAAQGDPFHPAGYIKGMPNSDTVSNRNSSNNVGQLFLSTQNSNASGSLQVSPRDGSLKKRKDRLTKPLAFRHARTGEL